MQETRQARVTILNAPGNLSSLKIPGWLKSEAASVQSSCGPHDFVILRVFLTTAQVSGIGQRKVDKVGYPDLAVFDGSQPPGFQ